MLAKNPHLSAETARRLTEHGVRAGDDGRLRWKFDPRFSAFPPPDLSEEQHYRLWAGIGGLFA